MPRFRDENASNKISDMRAQEEERYVEHVAPQHGMEYVNLIGYTLNPEALQYVPQEKAKQANLIPFDVNRGTLYIALTDPASQTTQDYLQILEDKGQEVRLFMCSKASLEHGWKRYADLINTTAQKHGVLDIDPVEVAEHMKTIVDRESAAKKILEVKSSNNARRISETIQIMFAGALALQASDIHIEPEDTDIRMRYRLDGVLQDIADLDSALYSRVMSRLKLLSNMVLNQRQVAQDGRFTFTIGEREIEVRSSVIPGANGESIVMRLLDPEVASFNMDNLGLNETFYKVMAEQLKRPNGLIITTGPTGSGKTTTLYAFLRKVHTPEVKIITIENPVEYKVEGIVQTQTDEDYTFSTGLRAILRQDPDVIMIGEIRDREVAETAIHAAQTGHLVFSTLHTNSAVGGFPRLIDIGVNSRMIGSSVNAMLGQRLMRVLCEDCKAGYQATEEEVSLVAQVMASHPQPTTITSPLTLYRPVGCRKCNNVGFKGRVGVYEAIIVDEAVEEAVVRDPREHIILAAAAPQKIPRMEHDGIDKVIAGQTSLPELQRIVDLTAALSQAGKINAGRDTEKTAEDQNFSDHIV